MDRLAKLFQDPFAERIRRLGELPPAAPKTVAFHVLGEPSGDFWLLELSSGDARAGRPADRPDVIVDGNHGVLVLLFSGKIDFARALAEGLLRTECPAPQVEALEEIFRQR